MISFFTKTLKVGVSTVALLGLAGAGAYAVAGKARTHAVVTDLHGQLLEAIDENIDDPAALRSQLREMEREYPKRIAEVNADLGQLRGEMRSLERELAISERVVSLADADLTRLEGQLASQASESEGSLVPVRAVSLDERVYSPGRAQARIHEIQNTRLSYSNRAADAKHDLLYLQKQSERLEELLTKLEGERAEFQTTILSLSRKIDSIARNDRLIKLMEKRNRTISECSRYEALSLDQISGRLAEINARQEAELDLLAGAGEEANYEDLARMQLATEQLEAKTAGYLEVPSDL